MSDKVFILIELIDNSESGGTMDLAHLKTFYVIAKEGSLTKAAHLLNTSQSSLSRTLQTLEYYAQAQLFERHARGLKLTPQGEKLFHYAQKIVQEHEVFLRSFHDKDEEMKGEIRIITTPYLAETELTSHLLPFMEEYPKIHLEIKTVTRDFDIEGADVAIRGYIPYRPELEQKHLLTHKHKLWASNEYLQKFGTPQNPADLDHHRLLAFSLDKQKNLSFSYSLNWLLYVGNNSDSPRKPFFEIPSQGALLTAAHLGYGILQFPEEWIRLHQSKLINVLPSLEAPILDLQFIFDKRKIRSKRILALYNHLYQSLNIGAS